MSTVRATNSMVAMLERDFLALPEHVRHGVLDEIDEIAATSPEDGLTITSLLEADSFASDQLAQARAARRKGYP